jgi:type IV pilus modification protein PilV
MTANGSDFIKTIGKGESARSGFSLIEVLIATVVIGIGFLAAASMQGMSVGGNSKSQLMTAAVYLAEDKIEELRSLDYLDIRSADDPEENLDEHGVSASNGLFDRTWTVTHDSPGVLMKTVDVTVTWSERGVDHNLTITTVVASY